jgi:hypothetical protein
VRGAVRKNGYTTGQYRAPGVRLAVQPRVKKTLWVYDSQYTQGKENPAGIRLAAQPPLEKTLAGIPLLVYDWQYILG